MRWLAAHTLLPALHCAALLLAEETGVRLAPARVSLGRFPANRPPSAEFILVNGGDAPLEGVRIRTGCGCVSAIAEGAFVPAGGRLTIRISVSPERISGAFSHGVFVEAGDNLLRASVTGESVPLVTVRPQKAVNLGVVACGSPYQAEFLLNAEEAVSLGSISAAPLGAEVIKLSSASFRIVLNGTSPEKPGRFRVPASVPVVLPEGWLPIEFVVFGNAVTASDNAQAMESRRAEDNLSHRPKREQP